MQAGLIYGLLLDGEGGARALNAEQVDHWLPSQGELWLHLDYAAYSTKE